MMLDIIGAKITLGAFLHNSIYVTPWLNISLVWIVARYIKPSVSHIEETVFYVISLLQRRQWSALHYDEVATYAPSPMYYTSARCSTRGI
jgi:hypothetical protein